MRTILVLLWSLALQMFRPCKPPWAVSPPVVSSLHPPSPLIIITHPQSWYLFSYRHGWWNPDLGSAARLYSGDQGCISQWLPPSNRHHRSCGDRLEGKGKTIRSVLCYIVCNNCAQCDAHTYEQTNSSLDWVLSHWAHFTVLRFIFACIMCITVYCVHV